MLMFHDYGCGDDTKIDWGRECTYTSPLSTAHPPTSTGDKHKKPKGKLFISVYT
jgi:hypothetical protein